MFNPNKLKSLLYEIPERSNKTVRELSKEVGKSEQYLSRELNPYDDGAKLGVVDFVFITAASKDLKPLHYILESLGKVAVDIPVNGQKSEAEWFRQVASVTKETGECISQMADALADGDIDREERTVCKKETYEALTALAALYIKL